MGYRAYPERFQHAEIFQQTLYLQIVELVLIYPFQSNILQNIDACSQQFLFSFLHLIVQFFLYCSMLPTNFGSLNAPKGILNFLPKKNYAAVKFVAE